MLTIPEIAAAKAYVLRRRATLKDYLDLYFILKDKYLTLQKLIKICQQKYKEFDTRLFLEKLIYFKDVESVAIQFLKKKKKVTKNKLQNYFEKEI